MPKHRSGQKNVYAHKQDSVWPMPIVWREFQASQSDIVKRRTEGEHESWRMWQSGLDARRQVKRRINRRNRTAKAEIYQTKDTVTEHKREFRTTNRSGSQIRRAHGLGVYQTTHQKRSRRDDCTTKAVRSAYARGEERLNIIQSNDVYTCLLLSYDRP